MYTVFITNQFQTTFAQGGLGGVKSVSEVTVKSKVKNFCPNYVQEFSLCTVARSSLRENFGLRRTCAPFLNPSLRITGYLFHQCVFRIAWQSVHCLMHSSDLWIAHCSLSLPDL